MLTTKDTKIDEAKPGKREVRRQESEATHFGFLIAECGL